LDIHAVEVAFKEGLLTDIPLDVGFDIIRNKKIVIRMPQEIPDIQFMTFTTKSGPLLLFFINCSL